MRRDELAKEKEEEEKGERERERERAGPTGWGHHSPTSRSPAQWIEDMTHHLQVAWRILLPQIYNGTQRIIMAADVPAMAP